MTAQIKFKAKIRSIYFMDNTKAYDYVQIPVIKRSHCDMPLFRQHKKYGAHANSDMFLNMINNAIHPTAKRMNDAYILILNEIPENATVDTSGFLAVVTFNL